MPHPRLLNPLAVGTITRPDGLRILIIQTGPVANIVQVQVDVRVGDDAEGMPEDGQRETAHFLEHLVASMLRSRHYPDGEAKAWVEEHGIYSNAFTSSVRTSHFMNGHGSKLREMIDIQVGAIADFIRHGTEHEFFKELSHSRRFKLEKEAVRRELSGKVDGPSYRMYEALNQVVFANHPRSVSQRVDLDSVETLSPGTVQAFFERHYTAKNMMVTVAGPTAICQTATIVQLLDQYTFGSAHDVAPRPVLVPFEDRPDVQREPVQIKFVPIAGASTVRVTMAWPLRLRRYETEARGQRDVHAVSALSNFLTGGFTSRLLKRLRVEEGLVYGVSAGRDLDERDGKYGVYQIETSVEADDVPKLVHDVFDELRLMAERGPTAAEMEKYQVRIKTSMERRITDRSPGSWVSDYANQALFAETFHVAALVDNTQHYERALAVTWDDVRRVANDVIRFFDGAMIFAYGADAEAKLDEDVLRGIIREARHA